MERRAARRPRVVSIPVRFVQSEQTQSNSAIKIQKLFRGFLVRKNVKQIISILRKVEEVGRRIESVKEVGIDEKERLRLHETLMSLLLKLDSVRGICNGVRDCRKRVIKKAIALQEEVDSIPSAASISVPASDMNLSAVEEKTKAIAVAFDQVAVEEERLPENVDSAASEFVPDQDQLSVESSAAASDNQVTVEEEKLPEKIDSALMEFVPDQDQLNDESSAEASDDHVAVEEESLPEKVNSDASMEFLSDQNQLNNDLAAADPNEQVAYEDEPKTIHCMIIDEDDLVPKSSVDNDECGMNPEEDEDMRKEDEKRKRSREYLLERMVEENEKLVGMMRELSEKNEMQMKLLNSLAQRVELLEKTVVCDKLARMKKKKRGSNNNNSYN